MSVGFIDVLTGFLCSTAALMIIIKYGAEQGGDLGGGPKDYMLYTAAISVPAGGSRADMDDSMIQLIIKKPNGEWLESAVTSTGFDYNESGFISFEDKMFYALGPSRRAGSDEVLYHVYGVAEIKPGEVWHVGLRYYSNQKLERKTASEDELQRVLSTPLTVTHKFEHLNVPAERLQTRTDVLWFGGDSHISAQVMQVE